MRDGWRDRYGVWNVVDRPKPRNHVFEAEVEKKVSRSVDVDGWKHGPFFIIDQANEETVDIPAWLRGLDRHPKPPGVDELVAEIGEEAADLFDKIRKLRRMYV